VSPVGKLAKGKKFCLFRQKLTGILSHFTSMMALVACRATVAKHELFILLR
jgi:hypothetical protein